MDRVWLAARLARGDSYAAIAREHGCSASTVAARARLYGLRSAHAQRHAARCVAALHFHHVDPAQKTFALGVVGVTRSLAAARAEARKCVVLCANCHAEVESGLSDVPVRSGEPVRAGRAVPDPG
jgi:transposase-like protein